MSYSGLVKAFDDDDDCYYNSCEHSLINSIIRLSKSTDIYWLFQVS